MKQGLVVLQLFMLFKIKCENLSYYPLDIQDIQHLFITVLHQLYHSKITE
jgi:hypothetical protein